MDSLDKLVDQSGFAGLVWQNLVMFGIGGLLIYLAELFQCGCHVIVGTSGVSDFGLQRTFGCPPHRNVAESVIASRLPALVEVRFGQSLTHAHL